MQRFRYFQGDIAAAIVGIGRHGYAVGVGIVLGFYPQRAGFFRHVSDFIQRIALRNAAGQVGEYYHIAAIRVGYRVERVFQR